MQREVREVAQKLVFSVRIRFNVYESHLMD